MFRIIEKREVVPNVHELVVEAPRIARAAKAGQFAILMADDESERVPFTLSDWDVRAGTVTLVVLEVGQASRKVALMNAGDEIAHLAGPLGVPLEIDNYGTVVLAGGCFGIGANVCIAKALKEAGNRVVVIVEARSHYLHYYTDKLRAIADELILTAIDGSVGEKGHCVDAIGRMLKSGERPGLIVAVGCAFMMMLIARETQPYGVKTLVAMNTIMVDGTGMCGACRVTVGGETKFACVDGPFFDAHQVDWEEVFARREAYASEETRVLEETAPHVSH